MPSEEGSTRPITSYAMGQLELLIVGPSGERTGGIARYIDEQRRHLDGVSVAEYRTGPGNADTMVAFVAGVLASLWRMVRFPFRRRPDVVHVHSSYRHSFYRKAFYVLFVAYVWRRPVVVHVHGSSFDDFLDDASAPVARFQSVVLGAAAAVVVLSEYWRDVLATRVPDDRIVVLPNAVPTEAYEPAFERDRQHVVFLSNLIERKGVAEFAAAIDALAARDDAPDFDVTVAGLGPLADRVEALAEDHEHVTYRGYVDEAEKRRLLDDATIYALPTYAEGLPIALLEAMAGGAAIVSTPVGSIPEVVGDENGRLVPAGDADALADALYELLRAPELVRRMGRRNRERAVEEFSWEATGDRLEALYAGLADDAERRPTVPEHVESA
ncbi:MAG TPA: glycosyltransferase family 4 protein [Halobacteriales archaeon]|nr:glycosyltransferase family 4 protein [Halobacteriales archaeon]